MKGLNSGGTLITTVAVHFIVGLMQIEPRPRSHINNYSCIMISYLCIIFIYLNDVTLIDLSV